MAITPDDKDWTWVLERPCTECGFDPNSFTFGDVPRLVRQNVKAWVEVFESPGSDGPRVDALRTRPDEDTWSPLEYAAHVRDVYRMMLARLNLMLVLDNPTFPNWDQDTTAEAQRYGKQVPETVRTQLVHAGTAFAAAVEDVPTADVARRGVRSNGSEFTVRTLATYALHDTVHHLVDVTGAKFTA